MIELHQVSRRYGTQLAVNQVSFRVEAGETLVLLGESGSGKTTTCKLVNRLIEPSEGRISIAGDNILTMPEHVLRRRIGYVFQRLGLFPHMTVAENIGITPQLLGWEPSRIRSRVDALLALVELDAATLAGRFPHELSGGQAQRVAVARALAAEPPVMLLDEPFGALDPITRERLQSSFVRIRKSLGLTAIFVTHDVLEAIALGDRIGVMKDGRLLQVGTLTELLTSPADPYVTALLNVPLRQVAQVRALLQEVSP